MPRCLLVVVLLLAGCAGVPRESHVLNPIGWPAKGLTAVGDVAVASGWPLLRELGRLLVSVGELTEAPALLVEGVVTFDPDRLAGSAQQVAVGSGATLASTWNLPFFLVPGGNIDLARDVDLVNEALAYSETVPVTRWRIDPGDERTFLFPPGTRARAAGKDLIYTVPGHGEVRQAAEANSLWSLLQWSLGTNFPAQERSWGFVVRSRARWDRFPPRYRTVTILHELYHQHMQMRQWLLGWTLVYWPSYLATFPFTGWNGHWAETKGAHAAGAVDRALADWESGS